MYSRAILEIIALAMYYKDKFHLASPHVITLPSNTWLSAIISQIALEFM